MGLFAYYVDQYFVLQDFVQQNIIIINFKFLEWDFDEIWKHLTEQRDVDTQFSHPASWL